MGETNENLWAPWRMEYIAGIEDNRAKGGCFLCSYRDRPEDDGANHVLWRSKLSLTLLNRFPYTSGHLLIAPAEHRSDPTDLPVEVWNELGLRIRDALRVLRKTLEPEGFNIGMNLSRCAGAGLPEHVHWHVVPRWGGDTNFMAVTGETRVIPEALEKTDEKFRFAARELGLPAL